MRRVIIGVALLLACGGQADQLEGAPGSFAPEMPSLHPVQPAAMPAAPGQAAMPEPAMPQEPAMPPAGMSPTTPQGPNTPPATEPDPPVTMPDPTTEPPVVTPEPDPICGIGGEYISASEQSVIDAFEGCEEIYNLDISAPLDLRPLASLRRIGTLSLQNVETLEGLESLEQVATLVLLGAALRDLSPLSALRGVGSLQIRDTSLLDLTGLENVTALTDLHVENNLQLGSLSGLALEAPVDSVRILDNPSLRDVTSLGRLREAWRIELTRNPQLTEVPVFFQLVTLRAFHLEANAALRAAPEFPSVTTLIGLTVVDNAALERFAFPALEYAQLIFVTGNPSLVEVGLPTLSATETVDIFLNQELDGVALGESLAGVSSVALRVAPDQTSSSLDPCPWTTDDRCDYLCAPGTDPICQVLE